jgi:hypothetical protein
MGKEFLNDLNIHGEGQIQFKTSAGANAGKIDQSGNDLVLSNAVGDIIIGNGSDDVYIGDGTNAVDIRFEQNMAIYADSSSTRTLTLGGANTSLVLESPTINGSTSLNATTINNKLTFTTANGYILFDYEPSGDTGEYSTEVPLIKVDMGGSETTILSRVSEYRGVALGADDTVWLRAGDTGSVIKTNVSLSSEQVLMSAEGGFIAYGFPGNDTAWSNRVEFQFRTDSSTASDNGLYIGDGSRTQFIDLSRNLKNIGTVSSGAITSTGKLTINTGSDDILTLNQTSTDNKWNYINFNSEGTREWFIGQDNDGNFDIYNDVIDAYAITINRSNNSILLNDTVSIAQALTVVSGDINLSAGNVVVGSQYGIRFNDANTRIYTNTDTPEDLLIEADQDILLTPDGQVSITGNLAVSGTVDGVDIATRDAVLTSTTTTADAALPKAGGTMTGDITMSNNRDIILSTGSITSDGTTFAFDGAGGKEVLISSARDVRVVIDDNNDDGDNTFEVHKHSFASGNELLTLNQSGNLAITGTVTANGTTLTGDQDLSGYMPKSGGTFTGSVTGTQFKLNNNVGNTNADSFLVYDDGGSVVYGMTLWNTSATSGEWATMIFGPNQSSRRISFGKANSNFGTNHAGIDELAWLDLDNGNYFTDGNIYPSEQTTHYVSSGRIQNWQTAYNWGNHASAGYASSSHNHAAGDITSGTFADARIAESNVTQHQAALSITESQISDLGSYITGLNFSALGNKGSGTGDYSTSGYLEAGRGSGGVALTHNDGYGNANVTFNHVDGTPEQAGSSGRIVVTTDSTTAKMTFELKDSVSNGTAVNTPSVMELSTSGVYVVGVLNLGHSSDTTLSRHSAGNVSIEGNKIWHAGGLAFGYTESGKNYPVELDGSNNAYVNVPWTDNDTVYTHPTHPGDDISIDTGALTGATVISDLDFNVTTDTLGHVTDANATIATRNLTAANIGAASSSHTHDDRYYTESEIQTFFNRGYISRHHETNLAVGWYTIATNTGDRALGEFQIWDTASSDHQSVLFNASHHFGTNSSNDITVLANSRYSGTNFRYIRIKENSTYDGAALQVYVDGTSNSCSVAIVGGNAQESGWVIKDWIADATDPGDVSGWASFTESCKVDLDNIINGGIATTGLIYSAPSSGTATAQYRVLTQADEGSGNGIDADTLDGQHASAFQAAGSYAAASHTHAATDITSGTLSTDRLDSSVIFGNNSSGTNEGNFDNWNNLSKTGFYSDDNATGKWSTANWSSVMHFKLYDNNNNYASQLGFDTYNADFFYRMKNNGTWTDWYEVYHEGHKPTPAEIGAAASSHTHAAGDITSGTFANARISESSVTQHVTGITSAQSQKLGYITVTQAVDLDDVESKAALGNTAYGWGNHASAGYLTSFDITTQTDSKYIRSNTSDNVTGHTEWQDDYHVRLGNSADMRLYHSSGNNYIDCHTGSLYIRTNANTDVGGDIHLRPRSSENGVIVRDDAEVELYYNNALKMETTSSGITVLGNVDSNGNVGNLNTTDDIGQQMEYGNTDVATLRCDANRWRVYFGGGGQSREAFTVEEGGEVGIGDSTPSYKLDVAGTIRATGDVIAYSDERVKENIKTIDNSLEKVNKLRGVEFNKIGEDKKSIGVIAQEIEKVLPEVVKTDDEGMKSVAYGNVVGVLIEAVKELNKEVEELKTKLNNGN